MNSASAVAVRAISGLTRLGILLAIARAYGPQAFGRLSLAVSIVEILRAFSDFGIDTVSIRRFVHTAPAGRRTELLPAIVGTKVLVSACFYGLSAGIVFCLANHFELLVALIAGLAIVFSGVLGAFSSYLQSCLAMSGLVKSTFVSSAAAAMFAAVAIYKHTSLLLVIAALPFGDVLNLILFCLTSGLGLRTRFDLQQTFSLLRESLPVGITSALVILYFRLDTVFVFKLAGAAALGLYSASFRIVEPALMIPNSFSTTAYAVLCSVPRSDQSFGQAIGVVWRTMWPAYAFVAGFSALGLLAGRLFLGSISPMYLPGYPVLAVLSVTLLVRSLNMGLTAIFNARAMYSVVTRIAGMNLGLNLVSVFFLVEKFGAFGAACAALLTESINTIIQGRKLASVLRAPKHQLAMLEKA